MFLRFYKTLLFIPLSLSLSPLLFSITLSFSKSLSLLSHSLWKTAFSFWKFRFILSRTSFAQTTHNDDNLWLWKKSENLLNLPANICSTTINVEKFCLDYSAPEGGKLLKTDMWKSEDEKEKYEGTVEILMNRTVRNEISSLSWNKHFHFGGFKAAQIT